MKTVLLLLALGSFSAIAHGRTPFPPVDEARTDSSFLNFRDELLQIVARKDNGQLLERVDDRINFSFGGGFGKADFIEEWRLTDKESSQSGLWSELEKVLRLGGEFNEDQEFIAPYTFNNWPDKRLDAFEHVVITGSNVRVRRRPERSGAVIYRASHEILALAEYPRKGESWLKVLTPSGQIGYVSAAFARSPIDYRAFFRKNSAGQWLMRSFIAGD